MQIDVGKERRNDTTLWSATVGFVVFPILQISGFQKFVNQLHQPGILDFVMNQAHKNIMVDIIEATFDVAFNKPPYTIKLSF